MTTTRATAFGQVLGGLLEERGLEATPETVGKPVIRRMVSTDAPRPGGLKQLVEELELSTEEMQAELVELLAFEREEALFSLEFRLRRYGVPELGSSGA